MRTEVVKALGGAEPAIVVSYPEALAEKVVAQRTFVAKTLRLARGSKMDMWDLVEKLQDLGFEREDFVVEPGQYAVRGGIVDVYSFASDLPFRIEFFDDEVDSLRTYDTVSQLSVKQLDRIDIVPNLSSISEKSEYSDYSENSEEKVSLMEYFGSDDVVWTQSLMMAAEQMEKLLADTRKAYSDRLADKEHPVAGDLPKPEEMSPLPGQRIANFDYGNETNLITADVRYGAVIRE
jgi:transcription-repair coupling factor (superfamily II helicase)